MPASIELQDGLLIARFSGILQKSELDKLQWTGLSSLEPDQNARVLLLMEDFKGWRKGDDWGDVTFTTEFGERIGKIAIIAEPEWHDQVLMFTGAGFRPTQIRAYTPADISTARRWLQE